MAKFFLLVKVASDFRLSFLSVVHGVVGRFRLAIWSEIILVGVQVLVSRWAQTASVLLRRPPVGALSRSVLHNLVVEPIDFGRVAIKALMSDLEVSDVALLEALCSSLLCVAAVQVLDSFLFELPVRGLRL